MKRGSGSSRKYPLNGPKINKFDDRRLVARTSLSWPRHLWPLPIYQVVCLFSRDCEIFFFKRNKYKEIEAKAIPASMETLASFTLVNAPDNLNSPSRVYESSSLLSLSMPFIGDNKLVQERRLGGNRDYTGA